MRIKLILRLLTALTFATVAVIFSALIPPVDGSNPLTVRVLVTVIAAVLGYITFPDIANTVTMITMSLFNLVVNRVTSEMLSQMLRLPRHHNLGFSNPVPQVGGMSITRPVILDTSAIIDGRILDIAKTGFISGLVLIPQFILIELQQVADSADDLKRARGRKGFEVIEDLKRVKGLKVEIWDKEVVAKAVDDKLVKLAKNLNGRIATTDFNLNRIASVNGVGVLNVNDLANAVKVIAVPGEKLEIKIMHLGKDPSQGVGYLPDGTMVVVQEGAELIGKTPQVEVTKMIQLPAGRMVFAKEA